MQHRKKHTPGSVTHAQALQKLRNYCAYQERCHQEVRSKLLDLGMRGHYLEDIMTDLIEEGYLNEERFAITYAVSKLRQKSWGKIKIFQELKIRKISDYCIRQAEIAMEKEGYQAHLENLITRYMARKSYDDLQDFVAAQDVLSYVQRKGFEYELVTEAINKYKK